MSTEVRCPECDARNGPDAQWCTQCYTSLVTEPPDANQATDAVPDPDAAPGTDAVRGPEVAPGVGTDGDAPPAPGAPLRPTPPPPPPPPPPQESADGGLLPLPPSPPGAVPQPSEPRKLQSGEGRFRETGEGLEWACGTCQEWNPIERITCTVCATPFGRTLGAEAEPDRPDVPAAALTVASLVLPGAGHWLLGLRGAGLLRAMLGLVWGLGGLTLFLQARGSGQSFLPALPLLLGWAVVAAGSANDAVVEGGGSGQIVLHGRVLLWLTLGVVGGTFAAVLVGVLSAVGG